MDMQEETRVMEGQSVPEAEAPEAEVPEKKAIDWKKELWSWCANLLIPMAVVLLLNTFVCKVIRVSGSSMVPTLRDRDMLFVQMLGYEPHNGDIVICQTDENSTLGEEYIVKRCIAVEGQTVTIDYEANTVAVDGVLLEELYINREEPDPMIQKHFQSGSVQVPEGCIFVMGDNRNHSTDSRDPAAVGMIPRERLIGGLLLRLPLGEWFQR